MNSQLLFFKTAMRAILLSASGLFVLCPRALAEEPEATARFVNAFQGYLAALGEFDLRYTTTRKQYKGAFFTEDEVTKSEHRLVFGDKGYYYWEKAFNETTGREAVDEASYLNGKFYRLDPRKCFTFGTTSNRFCERLATTGPLFYPIIFAFNFKDAIDLRAVKEPTLWYSILKASRVANDGKIQVSCIQNESQSKQIYEVKLNPDGLPVGWRMAMAGDMVGDCEIAEFEKLDVNGTTVSVPKVVVARLFDTENKLQSEERIEMDCKTSKFGLKLGESDLKIDYSKALSIWDNDKGVFLKTDLPGIGIPVPAR